MKRDKKISQNKAMKKEKIREAQETIKVEKAEEATTNRTTGRTTDATKIEHPSTKLREKMRKSQVKRPAMMKTTTMWKNRSKKNLNR